MMVTAEGTSSRRHGRRARALDEDSAQHRPTGDLAFFARRAVVDLPAADAPRPEVTRFDLAPVSRVAVLEREDRPEVASESDEPHTEVMPRAEEAAAQDAQEQEAPAPRQSLHAGLPGSDRGAKKSPWLGGLWGARSGHTHVDEGQDDAAESAVAEDADVQDAAVQDAVRHDAPAEQEGAEPGEPEAESAGVESVDANELGADEAGGAGGAAVEPGAEDLDADHELDAGAEAENAPAESSDDAHEAGPAARAQGVATAAGAGAAGAAAGSVAATIAGTRMREEENASGEASDWYEVGDLPADQAPDPKPAPRFEGQVLNRPSRTATGLGGWLTWLVVALVLVLLIVLLVTGVIGPGVLNSMPATTTFSLLNAGGFIS